MLVVDDHDVVHWGFRLMLGQLPWVQRCRGARTGSEALAICRAFEPHVALVDLFLGGESGPELCERLRSLAPAPRVILMSGAGGISPSAARAAGAAGFISKDSPASEIAKLVRKVGDGGEVFMASAALPALTDREGEILGLIAGGSTNREIARSSTSPRTRSRSTRAPCTASSGRATAPTPSSAHRASACPRNAPDHPPIGGVFRRRSGVQRPRARRSASGPLEVASIARFETPVLVDPRVSCPRRS